MLSSAATDNGHLFELAIVLSNGVLALLIGGQLVLEFKRLTIRARQDMKIVEAAVRAPRGRRGQGKGRHEAGRGRPAVTNDPTGGHDG